MAKRINELNTTTSLDMANSRIPVDTALGTFSVSPEFLLSGIQAQLDEISKIVGTLKLHAADLGTVIINQYYGGKGGAVSHNFVELYNCTDSDISLNGKSLQYIPQSGAAEVLNLTGTIKAHSSFLILGASAEPLTTATYLDLSSKVADQTWTGEAFGNKGIGFLLMDNTNAVSSFSDVTKLPGFIDGMSSDDGGTKIPQFSIGNCAKGQSKQKSIRKYLPAKSVNNAVDAGIVDYRIAENASKGPKCGADGEWK